MDRLPQRIKSLCHYQRKRNFLRPVYFFAIAQRPQNIGLDFGPFCPILAILSRIHQEMYSFLLDFSGKVQVLCEVMGSSGIYFKKEKKNDFKSPSRTRYKQSKQTFNHLSPCSGLITVQYFFFVWVDFIQLQLTTLQWAHHGTLENTLCHRLPWIGTYH